MSVMMKWDSRNVLHTIIIYVYVLLISLILLTGCEKELPPVEELLQNPQLPDPLIMLDGTPVETEEDWYEKRRPELKKLFQHYVYGYFPEKPEFTYITGMPCWILPIFIYKNLVLLYQLFFYIFVVFLEN